MTSNAIGLMLTVVIWICMAVLTAIAVSEEQWILAGCTVGIFLITTTWVKVRRSDD